MARYRIHPVFPGLLLFFAASLALQSVLPGAFMVFLSVTLGWIISLSLHEWAHAYTAYRFGDRSVAQMGYLSLNPLKYTHPVLSIVLPLLFLFSGGIGLPGGAVYINRAAIGDRRALSLVSLAGPAVNALLAVLLALVLRFMPLPSALLPVLSLLFFLQISALLLNLMPIPGLDGFGVLEPFLPPAVLQRMQNTAGLLILVLMFMFFTNTFVSRAFWKLIVSISVHTGIAMENVLQALEQIRFWDVL